MSRYLIFGLIIATLVGLLPMTASAKTPEERTRAVLSALACVTLVGATGGNPGALEKVVNTPQCQTTLGEGFDQVDALFECLQRHDAFRCLGAWRFLPPPAGYYVQPSYQREDCLTKPAGTVCIGFNDGYIWLVEYDIWESEIVGEWYGQPIQKVTGTRADGTVRYFYHILNTELVYFETGA